jgi:ATP-dependent exoDNAse (exonuclease V) alpha subunit
MEIERGRVTNVASFETSRGTLRVGVGDRVMIRGTDKKRGLLNGALASVEKIEDQTLTLRTDRGKALAVDLADFDAIELGYAGTIYRGQGKTLDDVYLLHTRHWRDASSYVALTRARHSTQVFVAREEARDLPELAVQMARQNNRGATIMFEADSVAAERQEQKISSREKAQQRARERE